MEKPTAGQRLNSLCKFVYNSDEGKVLGRGARSWAEIGIFYLIYYACLAGFFAGTIAVFYETIDNDVPKLQLDDSLLKANPGMGFQPMPDIETTLIISSKDPDGEEYKKKMVESIKGALKKYKGLQDALEECKTGAERQEGKKACRFDYAALTKDCNEENNFGMDDDQPCVLLKLNRIYGWKPDVYKNGDKDIPKEIQGTLDDNQIMVQCNGENPADEDNISQQDIKYYPSQGFPTKYFPYYKQQDYLSPLIFVKFNKVTPNIGLMIECKSYAKNIKVDSTDKEGMVHFELLVNSKKKDK